MFNLFYQIIKLNIILLLLYGCQSTNKAYEYNGFYFGEIKSVYILSTYSDKYNINIQGNLSNEIKITLPYTNTNDNFTLPEYKKEIDINRVLIKNYSPDLKLTLSYDKQKLKKGKGIIFATIKVKNKINSIDLIQLDPDYLNELLLANIELPLDSTRKKKFINIKNIGAAKNKKSDNNEFTYLYIPIVSPTTNKIWLNNNLGADYNLWGGVNYNPYQQAISPFDYKSYGSKFQWGRKADGHELTNYHTSFSGKSLYKNTNNIKDKPETPDFILDAQNNFDWRLNKNDELWIEGNNNICPDGYIIPTEEDFINEFINSKTDDNFLKLTYAGLRIYNRGSLNLLGDYGFYWTSDISGEAAKYFNISEFKNKIYINSRANGFSVRCIKI